MSEEEISPDEANDVGTVREERVRDVRAETVHLEQSAAQRITADRVTIEGGGARTIQATQAEISQGGAVAVHAQQLEVQQGAVCFATGDFVSLTDSMVGVVGGSRVAVKNSRALFVLARSVEGEVHTVFDRQTALAFGAAAGLVCGLLCFVRGLLARR